MKQRELQAVAVAIVVAIVIDLLIVSGVINPYWELIIQYACIVAIATLGLNIIYGFNGQFSLGHVAFYGLGAYASALVTKAFLGGSPLLTDALANYEPVVFLASILIGGLFAALVAYLIGLPILRLGSDYLGIATLGFGFIVKVAFDNADGLIPAMGGARGMTGIIKLTSWPWVAGVAIVAVVVMRNFVYSSHGRAILSVREDEIAANSMGINIARYKTIAFVMGCFYAGVAGALYAHLYTFLHPSNFDFLKSIDLLLIVVLGGLGSMSGTIIAALGWTFLLEGLRVLLPTEILDFRFVIYPLLLIAAMLLRPQGLFGGMELPFLRAPKVEKRSQRVTTES